MSISGTSAASGPGGPEVFVELRRGGGAGPLRAQLEAGLREAVRTGRLAAGSRVPSSRALARDLAVSRRLVVEAYAQLAAEGYLRARSGGGTIVAAGARAEEPRGTSRPQSQAPRFDFFPGAPDLAGFPRAAWLRAVGEVLRTAPDHALGYPDPAGVPELRTELAGHLGRSRGVVARAERIVVCGGVTQALALLGGVLERRGTGTVAVAVEQPSLPEHRRVLAATGVKVVPVPVDAEGLRVDHLRKSTVDAVVATPAHQFPTGVALSPGRRAELLAWAQAGRLVVEDDYDAAFRYDRAPIGALQGLAPEAVIYAGSASKSLAPGLRLGWLVLPAALVDEVVEAKRMADFGDPVLEQLAFARLLASGAYDRHLRSARRRYRARRDALVAALADHLPGARVRGIAAGLHAVVEPPLPVASRALHRACARRSVGAYFIDERGTLTLGYANLSEPAIREGVRRLAEAWSEVAGGRSAD